MQDTLKQWAAEKSKKAFMLVGARQTGKTYVIRQFARSNFKKVAEINFLEDKNAQDSLLLANDTEDFITRLGFIADVSIDPKDTLIFLDEIQEAPDLLTMLKFLVDKGEYKVIVSGSMLGTELKGIRSFPVGYVEIHRMFPLDFEEFCWAQSVPQSIVDDIRKAYIGHYRLDGGLHERLTQLFRYYVAVGGMPEVVARFVEGKNDMVAAREAAAAIVEQYRYDITKYAKGRAPQIRKVYDAIPSQLDKQNKRFRMDAVEKGAFFDRLEYDFAWLVDAGVALPAYCVSEPKTPLARTAHMNKFKLYESDTGLLLSQYEPNVSLDVITDETKTNFGSVYENAVAQALACETSALYYYYSSKKGEVDFLVTQNSGRVLPIEVKSGKDYKLHTSLNSFLGNREYGIDEAVVLTFSNLGCKMKQGKPVWYLPLYMAFCIAESANGKLPDVHLPIIEF